MKIQFSDNSNYRPWIYLDSIEDCWDLCELKKTKCKSISYFEQAKTCKLFDEDWPLISFKSGFISLTINRGLISTKVLLIYNIFMILTKREKN